MSKYEVGQMVQIQIRNEDGGLDWVYAVAINIYDNKTEFLTEYNHRHMVSYDDDAKDKANVNNHKYKVVTLYQNGRPVFSKRSLFGLGRYTFDPTTKDGEV
ncbi:hypothetical protein pW4_7 [Bacillus phage pW4]|uniref:Uncharacterized protein n=1 Tax=Bacillus phage pW4 TaxID=2500560 RepID=A0A3T0IHZ0_9CAUD|nr:hypothetical protein PP656_gp005 [Bacillus phage pW4]AZU99030.1 hypothetical protein pW4_7 [Bacillus phage pW4]